MAAGTKVSVIKSGFQGTEGPIGMPDGSLIFTETQANRITRIAPDGTTSTFLENTNGSNGLAWDAKGRLISVQTTPGQTKIGVIYPKGSEAVLTDNFDGKPFGRPNDLVVSTRAASTSPSRDPTRSQARRRRRRRRCRPRSITWRRAGRPIKVADGIERPNGIMLSRDEKTLVRQQHATASICWRSTCRPMARVDQSSQLREVSGRRRPAQRRITSGADGLAIDNDGRVYAATSAGVEVFDVKGDASRDDSTVARAAEHRLCRQGQEDAVHRRSRLGVQGRCCRRRASRGARK